MNIAVIFAGGTGQRMNSKTRPKQFLELHEKPILVYTLEAFQKHEEIDGIILVTLKDWINYCLELKEKYHLTKLKSIIPGGKTATESAFNGLARANELFPSDSIVLIHDGVRPLVDEETITKNIECVKEHPYVYTAQAVTAIFTVLLGGKSGEAYNVSNPETYCSIYEMGKLVSEKVANGKIKVIVAKNGDISKYPVPSCLKLDISKIENLGWKPEHNLLWMYNRLIKTM